MRAREAVGVVLLAVVLLVGVAGASTRTCVRDGCRAGGRACMQAYRDRKQTTLDACAAETSKDAVRTCRAAARGAARDGMRSCREATAVCAACCRQRGSACPVAVCGDGVVETGESCDGTATGSCADGCR